MEKRSQNSLVLAEMQKLVSSLFLDLQRHHPHLAKNLSLDLKTLIKRSENEGISFLTQTLPKVSKALVRALETGQFVCPQGFTKLKGTSIPRFLGGMMKSVLNDDGSVKSTADHTAIVDLIEVGNLFYKLDLPFSRVSEERVISNFKEVEAELSELSINEDDPLLDDAADLVEKILRDFDPMEILPRHGPGAVATRERGSKKWTFKRKYGNIHRVYPYYTYFVPSRMSLLRNIRSYNDLEPLESGTARVVLVPKDSRGPRLISMEPLEYQFIQQGLARALVGHLERKSFITRGSVNFTDQGINQSLALHNSCTRRYATLDMKEASDRVTVKLVERLFSKRLDVLRSLLATRTTSTELPSGEVIPLCKFAPMGSALCFPVEALVFFVLAKSIMKRDGITGKVYVYGDDIIVPRELAPVLFRELPNYGLKFNEDKCFIDGYFRESCGMDAYKGFICTPVRMRRKLPRSRKEASALVSGVEFSNYLWERGYWNASTYVKNVCENINHVGVVRSPKVNFGGLSYVSFTTKGVIIDETVRMRFNKDLQGFQIRSLLSTSSIKRRKWDSEARLFANLVSQYTGADTVPHTVTTKMRWIHLFS